MTDKQILASVAARPGVVGATVTQERGRKLLTVTFDDGCRLRVLGSFELAFVEVERSGKTGGAGSGGG